MSGPLGRGLFAYLVGAMLLSTMVPRVLAQEPGTGYPAAIVPLPAGLLMCEAPADVEATFRSWQLALERRLPEQLAAGCVRVPAGLLARIEYLRRIDTEHWTADLLRYFVFREQARGISILVGIYYGYGAAKLKPGMPAAAPVAEQL